MLPFTVVPGVFSPKSFHRSQAEIGNAIIAESSSSAGEFITELAIALSTANSKNGSLFNTVFLIASKLCQVLSEMISSACVTFCKLVKSTCISKRLSAGITGHRDKSSNLCWRTGIASFFMPTTGLGIFKSFPAIFTDCSLNTSNPGTPWIMQFSTFLTNLSLVSTFKGVSTPFACINHRFISYLPPSAVMPIENPVNCWNNLRAATQQRVPKGRARLAKKFADWSISSQGPEMGKVQRLETGYPMFATGIVS